jgi:hypothetical protein
MPNVTATPRSMSNGDVVTSFTDSVETTSRTYTYPTQQNGLVVVNKGRTNITLTVNATPYTILPNQTQRVTADFTAFSIVSTSGVQHFDALATAADQKGFIAGAAWNGGNLLQLGVYRLWVDSSGRLRIKNANPSSDVDGTIVGAQV